MGRINMPKKATMRFNGLAMVPDIDIEYRGFNIKAKMDFGNSPYKNVNTYRKGYVVVKDGVNAMPGAIWATSIVEAKSMIDSFIEADGSSAMFWVIQGEKQGKNEYEEV